MNMRTLGDDTVRGGQTVFHGIRMWSQLVRVGILAIAGLTLAVPIMQLWRDHFGYDTYAAAMVTLAEVKLSMGYGEDAGQEVLLENGDRVVARNWRYRRVPSLARGAPADVGHALGRHVARGQARGPGSWWRCWCGFAGAATASSAANA